jgi:hypothetical protein
MYAPKPQHLIDVPYSQSLTFAFDRKLLKQLKNTSGDLLLIRKVGCNINKAKPL